MTPHLHHLALFGLLLPAQSPAPQVSPAPKPLLNHTLVFLDPAHGGDDAGAHLVTRTGELLLEKDLTLSFASRLRSQLSALGLTVLSSREADPAAPAAPLLSPDLRAGLANHVHPVACIVLHATATGSGVHLITSALPSPLPAEATPALTPWDAAQAAFLPQSDRLAAELSTAITRAGIPVHVSRASIRPLDSLTCPAVLIELAPFASVSPADSGYQARVAQAVATALVFWRGHAEPETPAGDPALLPGAPQP